MNYQISAPGTELEQALQDKIDHKTKPPGALGRLEQVALQVGLIQQTLTPELRHPVIAVFAADHGIAEEKVSAFPAEVTAQMVLNFLGGGAAINVFARQHGIELKVVDAGVASQLAVDPGLTDARIAAGTRNFLHQPAMTAPQCATAFERATVIVDGCHAAGTNVIGFGEMGIANTSSAAVLTALFTGLSLADAVGPGTGLDADGVAHKQQVLQRAVDRTGLDHAAALDDPLRVMAEYGGFEIAMICGGMLRAASHGMLVLVDGFIATSAFLCAHALQPNVRHYCLFSHRSEERGHAPVLADLGVEPLLDLGMRLGEGSGAAVALPVVRSAVAFLNEMSSFAEAEVSGKTR